MFKQDLITGFPGICRHPVFYPLVVALLLFAGTPSLVLAQGTPEGEMSFALGGDLEQMLLPLDTIVEIAMQRSPTVKYQDALVRQGEAQVVFMKRLWQNNVMGYANVSTGNQSVLLSGNTSPDVVQNQTVANGYRFGVNVNIPLYEFSGRKYRIRLYEEQLNAARYKGDEVEREIFREIVGAYYNLITAQHLIRIRAQARENADLHLMMAEKQFKQGSIPIGEYARVSEIAAKAQAEFEIARRDFSTAYFQFEKMVGVNFKELIRKK